jgi:GNAT superfamily N-acetyltransferase
MAQHITFLHTSPAHVPTFTALLARLQPGAQATHIVNEDLLVRARALGPDHPGVIQRVQAAVHAAASGGAQVVLCTCSTIGGVAEATPADGSFVPMRVDRAMADRAAALGPEVLVVAALDSTLQPTADLIQDSASRLGRHAHIQTLYVEPAWPHFEAGRLQAYHQTIASSIRAAMPRTGVVVLAQASMAPAAELLLELGVPVLSSPALGVAAALERAHQFAKAAQVTLPASPIAGLQVMELGAGTEALLQRFFEENPAYFCAVEGEPAGPDAAHEAIHDPLPAGWPYTKKWVIGYVDSAGQLVAMADVTSDLLAPGVWHIGLFIVATARHGSGDAQALFAGLQAWALANGAQWLRLGVVQGHARAERFWQQQGFVQTRVREGVQMGQLTNKIVVMFKPLTGGTTAGYLQCVPRDRADRPDQPVGAQPS